MLYPDHRRLFSVYAISSTPSSRKHSQTFACMAGFAAPWRDKFLQDVSKLQIPAFVLATLHSPYSQPHLLPQEQTPRARTVVFRGMWASLPRNDRNPAPQNDSVYESDLPTITTDVRMEKVAELL